MYRSEFEKRTGGSFISLQPEEFRKRIENEPGVLILDVRTATEFESGHVPKAININIMERSFNNRVSELDQNKSIYVYCRSGARSSSACTHLLTLGFPNVFNLEGGLANYSGPLE